MSAPNLTRSLPAALALALAVVVVACAWWPPLQQWAETQADAGLQRALISFASARTLNGLISVLQGTEISVLPLGVGVTLTLGQVLDPVNDLVEQFGSLMLLAAVVFGVQKTLLVIGAHWAVSLGVSALALCWAALRLRARAPAWLSGLLLVAVMLRFAIPAAGLAGDWVFRQWLAQDYQAQQASMASATGELRELTPQTPQTPPTPASGVPGGWWERMKDRASAALPDIDYERVRQAVEGLPERLVRLIVIFLLQTLVIPLLTLWLLYRLALGLLRT